MKPGSRALRALLDRHGLHLGLHTLSAVNIAETSPFLRDAVDAYLKGYIELATRLPRQGHDRFRKMFDQIEGAGYRGHYMLAFGSIDDMKAGRDALLQLAGRS